MRPSTYNPHKDMKAIFAFLALASFLMPSAVALQTYDNCDNTGKYCFGGAVYDCVDGKPQLIEYCRYSCKDAACTQEYIEPGVAYDQPERPPPASSDGSVYLAVVLAVAAIAILYIVTKRRK